jgi:hypothetical protein
VDAMTAATPITMVIMMIVRTMVAVIAMMMIIDMYGVLPYMNAAEGDQRCLPSRL